jgi:hypothetical protein
MAAQTNRQVTETDSDGATFTIDVTFDDVTIRVGLITWNNTSTRRKAFVVLSQPGKPTISRVVAAAGVAPAQGEVCRLRVGERSCQRRWLHVRPDRRRPGRSRALVSVDLDRR